MLPLPLPHGVWLVGLPPSVFVGMCGCCWSIFVSINRMGLPVPFFPLCFPGSTMHKPDVLSVEICVLWSEMWLHPNWAKDDLWPVWFAWAMEKVCHRHRPEGRRAYLQASQGLGYSIFTAPSTWTSSNNPVLWALLHAVGSGGEKYNVWFSFSCPWPVLWIYVVFGFYL